MQVDYVTAEEYEKIKTSNRMFGNINRAVGKRVIYLSDHFEKIAIYADDQKVFEYFYNQYSIGMWKTCEIYDYIEETE
jgi:hypothetical protein